LFSNYCSDIEGKMHFFRGDRSHSTLTAHQKAVLYRWSGLVLTIVVATTAWVLAVALASRALGVHANALVLVGLGLVIVALSIVAAATMLGDR
jgi:hypothetical protein